MPLLQRLDPLVDEGTDGGEELRDAGGVLKSMTGVA
jgi:hypothetical protein